MMYFKDGTKHTGGMHKMPNGQIHSGKTALVADTPLEQWPNELPPYLAQPWDCMSHTHSVYKLEVQPQRLG